MVIEIEDTKTSKDLKQLYLSKIGGNSEQNIRLFCIGQELKNKKQLYKYQLASNYVAICHFVK